MKKVVRLTESDLTRVIKRIIKEMQNDVPTEIAGCATEVLTLSDLTKIPTCIELATQVIEDKKIPTDIMKGMKCASELSTLQKGPDDALEFMNCVLGKINNPVMNERRYRRR
jgi:hypothetical protein